MWVWTVALHMLQVANTQPYHNKELDGVGLFVSLSLLIDKTMHELAPLHFFSETKNCRVVKPEHILLAKSILVQGWGYIWGRHTQTQCLKWQYPLQNHEKFW